MSILTDNVTFTGSVINAIPSLNDEFAAVRSDARAILDGLKLPAPKAEEYKFTPITRTLEKAFSSWPGTTPASTVTDIKEFLVAGEETSVVVLANGKLDPRLSQLGNLKGLIREIAGDTKLVDDV